MKWRFDGDEDPGLLTRRQFIFLTGKGIAGAYLLTQAGSLTLAERPPVEIIDKGLYDNVLRMEDLDSVLKELYLPLIREHLTKDAVLLTKLGPFTERIVVTDDLSGEEVRRMAKKGGKKGGKGKGC